MDIRTDLAIEWLDMAAGLGPEDWDQQETAAGGITLATTRIRTPAAAARIGKPVGKYLTASFTNLLHDAEQNAALAELLGEHLRHLLPATGAVLVLGLGNPAITPDAVGPRAVEGVMATRHIGPALAAAMGITFRPVAALAPGVLGQTGVEVQEIARALVRDTAPAALVVIDALAARATERLGRTVQLSDAGIVPGSGVGNARSELSQQTLGVPVIAVGVPTVVDVGTLVREYTQDEIADERSRMMVTSKEIDQIVARVSKVLALAVNRALQPQLSAADIALLTD